MMLEQLTAEDDAELALQEQAVFSQDAAGAPSVEAPLTCVCGEIFLPGAKFCSECGAKVSSNAPATVAPAVVAASPVAPVAEVATYPEPSMELDGELDPELDIEGAEAEE